MGEFSSSDCSWKKMVIAKANNEWMSTIKTEQCDDATIGNSINQEREDKTETFIFRDEDGDKQCFDSAHIDARECILQMDPLRLFQQDVKPKHRTVVRSDSNQSEPRSLESPEGRATRLAKMSAYSARRLANESPDQRALRLRRMSEYAARRIARETKEQRSKRLARMSAYAAKRLASETPEQRQIRLAKMSAYSAKRQAQKRASGASSSDTYPPSDSECSNTTKYS